MSVEYCERCHIYVDTDHDTEHFIYNSDGDEIIDCIPAMEYREELATDNHIAESKER